MTRTQYREVIPEAQSGTEGQRECARQDWCAARTVTIEHGETIITPALGWRAFCDTDEKLIARCLAALPGLHGVLCAMTGLHVPAEVLIRSPFGPSLGLNGSVDEAARLVAETLASWAERVCARAGLLPFETYEWLDFGAHRRPRIPAEVVGHAVGILAERLPVLFSLPYEPMVRPKPSPAAVLAGTAPEIADVGDTIAPGSFHEETALVMLDGAWAGKEILSLEYGARAVLGLVDPQPEALLGVECRNKTCSLRALERAPLPWHEGETEFWSRCKVCGHLMTEGEYRVWVGQLAAYQRARLAAMPVLGESAALCAVHCSWSASHVSLPQGRPCPGT